MSKVTSSARNIRVMPGPTRRRLRIWGYEVHDISDGSTAEDIDRRLWLELTPEQYGLVRELVRLESDAPILALLDETDRLIAGLEAHLPGLAPAIRIVAEHLIERGAIYEDEDQARVCCDRGRRDDGADSSP